MTFLTDALGWFWHIWGMLYRPQTPIFCSKLQGKGAICENDDHKKPPVSFYDFLWSSLCIYRKMMIIRSHEIGSLVTSYYHPYHTAWEGTSRKMKWSVVRTMILDIFISQTIDLCKKINVLTTFFGDIIILRYYTMLKSTVFSSQKCIKWLFPYNFNI